MKGKEVTSQGGPVTECRFNIEGMDCPGCAVHIENGLRDFKSVSSADVDFLDRTLRVSGVAVDSDAVIERVNALGYRAAPLETQSEPKPPESTGNCIEHRRIVPVAAGAVLVALAGILQWQDALSPVMKGAVLAAALLNGLPILKQGLKALYRRRLDINLLMAVAVIGAMLIGEWLEAGVIVVLFALSELLEDATVDRSRRAVEALIRLRPATALRFAAGGGVEEIPVETLKVGDKVLVKPSGVIPVDGVVVAGLTSVNQAALTGESLPVEKGMGTEVFTGTVNGDGAIEVEVRRVPGDTTFDRIVKLVKQAQSQKAPLQRFVERFAAWYTPAVFISAILIACLPPLLTGAEWSVWIYRALAMLVIACPCALVISTPVTIVSALTGAARRGVLVKGGAHLEGLHRIKAVAFDKTGTVTVGVPAVQEIVPLNGLTSNALLKAAAAVEMNSEHIIGRSIIQAAQMSQDLNDADRAGHFTSIPGRGARGMVGGETVYVGNHSLFEELGICDNAVHEKLSSIEDAIHTAVLVGSEKKLYGVLALADEVRREAAHSIAELRKLGVGRISLVTGDNHRTGEAVGRTIGADEVKSELLPHQKLAFVRDLKDRFKAVMMVGDGVNDAPALALADVGVAMGGSGIDASLETADVVLTGDNLDRLPYLFRLSKRAHRIIVANIAFAIGTKALFLSLAAVGLATMWMAVFADTGVAMLVILNGMRALKLN